MFLFLDIVGVVLILQGIAPLAQEMTGQDPEDSFFIVNKLAEFQPFASIALAVIGALLLTTSYKLRKARK